MALKVDHETAANRFTARVDGGVAECAYILGDGVMNIVHTEVPRSARGHGIAAVLVDAALAHARAQGLRVQPSCSYVRSHMRRHPETMDLLER